MTQRPTVLAWPNGRRGSRTRRSGNLMTYEYRILPFVAHADKRNLRGMARRRPQAAAEQLQSIIDEQVKDGWEFYSLENKSVRAPAQFIAWLLGIPPGEAWLDLVVFRRER